MERPLILISNDDGYTAKGINCLVDMVKDFGDVIVVAPDSPRSGTGMAITSTIPVRNKLISKEEGITVWACSGTPVDCVKMAFEKLCPRRPSLVLGGINHGNNCGVNAHYSGTVSIAFEGCLKGIPSIAFSLGDMDSKADFEPMRQYVRKIVKMALEGGIPKGVCLNVNAPKGNTYKGIKVQKMGMGDWHEEWQECEHPHGGKYYWISGYYKPFEPDDETTDTWAFENGYVAITPLHLDLTMTDAISLLEEQVK